MSNIWLRRRTEAIAAGTFGALALALVLGDRTPTGVVALLVSIGLAGSAASLSMDRPVVAFAILVALAATSRVTIELPLGTMRLEQPAIAAIGLSMVMDRGVAFRRPRGPTAAIVVGLTVYLTALTVSSATQTPFPIESLRLVAWHAISIMGGIVAYLLLRRAPDGAMPVFVAAGAISGAIGIAIAVGFLIIGPSFDLGIQGIAEGFPKIYALSWEANLYASFLGAMVPFAIERFRRRPSLSGAVLTTLITIGLALAVTRGAYLGLLVGLLTQLIALRWMSGSWRFVAPAVALIVLAVLVAIPTPNVLLPIERIEEVAAASSPALTQGPTVGPSSAPGGLQSPTRSTDGSATVPSTAVSALPSIAPTPSPQPYPDTIGFRLARVPLALEDLSRSPLFGLGADSFGQRHADASQGGAPDHIGLLVIALPYESGIVGSAGFCIAAGGLALLLIRALRRRAPLAAAFTGSLVSLLVAYQATNALHFSINWLLAGAAAAFALSVLTVEAGLDVETDRG